MLQDAMFVPGHDVRARAAAVPLSVLVPPFSRLALSGVALLALTGLYSALIEIRTLEALTLTTYGWAVAR